MKKVRDVKDENGIRLYQCTSCWEYLSKENFSTNRSWFDCLSSKCKKCMSQKVKESRHKNREKYNAYQREYLRKRYMAFESWWLQQLPSQEETIKYEWLQPAVVQDYTPVPASPHDVIITWEPEIVPLTSSNDNVVPLTFSNSVQPNWKDLDYESLFPEAYKEIMSDEDIKEKFNSRSDDYKIKDLERRQEKYNKKKEEQERKELNENFRELAERAYRDTQTQELDEKELNRIEHKMWDLQFKEDKKKFMKTMLKFKYTTFKVSRESILDNIKWMRDWTIKDKDVII